jgi:hypothetical protein
MAPERVAEHRPVDDGLGAGVEGRRQLLHRLVPPVGNEPPAHRHKLGGAAIATLHHIDGVRRRDVVVGLQIASCSREVVEVADFLPCIALGEASAHSEMVSSVLQEFD